MAGFLLPCAPAHKGEARSMKTSHKAIGAIAAVAIGAALINDLVNREAHDLERVSNRVGLSVDCEILKHDSGRWGVCRYPNGAMASAWLKRNDQWVTANGNAIEVIDRLARLPTEQLQNIPSVMHDRSNPANMPTDLLQR
jgi:hypothetical protein